MTTTRTLVVVIACFLWGASFHDAVPVWANVIAGGFAGWHIATALRAARPRPPALSVTMHGLNTPEGQRALMRVIRDAERRGF